MNDLKLTLTGNIVTVEVPSSRGGNHKVQYNIETDEYCCTCEDFFYRERVCKHIREAKEFIEQTLSIETSDNVVTSSTEDNTVINGLIDLRNELKLLKSENKELDLRASYRIINSLLASQRS